MSTEFYAEEIRRALEEQSFGIKSFNLLESDTSGVQARATVILLEGQKITILLNSQGYSVRDSCPHVERRRIADFFFEIESNETTSLDTKESVIFDYIDSLLQSVSREYETQRHQIWVRKLEGLLSEN